MKLTMGDALELQPLCRGEMVAGRGGANREIRSITVIEVPDKSDFLESHLLAISSLCAIANDVDEQLNLVRLLNNRQSCGLVMFNVGAVMPEIDPRLIELCDEIDFPLVSMPLNISYYQVIEAVMSRLLENQSQKLEASVQLYGAFMDQLLDSRDDYSTMFGTLSRYIHYGVLFFNHNQKCTYAYPNMPQAEVLEQLTADIRAELGLAEGKGPMRERVTVIGGTPYLLIPVVNKRTYYGSLVVMDAGVLSDLDQLVLSQAKKALCVAAFGNVRMDEYCQRVKNEFLRDLFQGNYGNEGLIISQGRELGFDMQNVGCVIVVSPFLRQDTEACMQVLDRIYFHVRRVMPDDIVTLFEDTAQVAILCGKTMDGDYTQAARMISAAIEAGCGQAPSIGIGPPCSGVEQISQSYKRATEVILLSERIFGAPRYKNHESMRLYGLLFNSIDPEEAERMVRLMLGPLRQYDKTYNANLEQTFYELLHNNDSTAKVADIMYLHKNTVLQRKNKIISLYKRDPFLPPERLQFELAFLLLKIFDLRP